MKHLICSPRPTLLTKLILLALCVFSLRTMGEQVVADLVVAGRIPYIEDTYETWGRRVFWRDDRGHGLKGARFYRAELIRDVDGKYKADFWIDYNPLLLSPEIAKTLEGANTHHARMKIPLDEGMVMDALTKLTFLEAGDAIGRQMMIHAISEPVIGRLPAYGTLALSLTQDTPKFFYTNNLYSRGEYCLGTGKCIIELNAPEEYAMVSELEPMGMPSADGSQNGARNYLYRRVAKVKNQELVFVTEVVIAGYSAPGKAVVYDRRSEDKGRRQYDLFEVKTGELYRRALPADTRYGGESNPLSEKTGGTWVGSLVLGEGERPGYHDALAALQTLEGRPLASGPAPRCGWRDLMRNLVSGSGINRQHSWLSVPLKMREPKK